MHKRTTVELALSSLLLVLALALSAPTVTVLGSSHYSSGHTLLSKLVLTLKDLPTHKGWGQTGGVQPNAAVAIGERVSLSTINHYRITGYGTSLFRRSKGSGIVSIGDSVGLYKSVAASIWQYKKFTSVNKQPVGTKTLPMSRIGDQGRGFYASSPRLGVASLYFRRGVYAARLDMTSLGPLKVSDVLRLARILDHRIKNGH